MSRKKVAFWADAAPQSHGLLWKKTAALFQECGEQGDSALAEGTWRVPNPFVSSEVSTRCSVTGSLLAPQAGTAYLVSEEE